MDIKRLIGRIREYAAVQGELHERQARLDRPWDELLHWTRDGHGWRLSGSRLDHGADRPTGSPAGARRTRI